MFKTTARIIENHRSSLSLGWRISVWLKDFLFYSLQNVRSLLSLAWVLRWQFGCFLKPNISYAKYVIICHPRTGSNLLRTLLDSHPAICSYGEIFNGKKNSFKGQDITLLRATYLPGLFRWMIFPSQLKNIQAVGFKLLYRQGWSNQDREFNPNSKNVWTFLKTMPDIRIIQLLRRNSLRSLVSWKISNSTKKWALRAGQSPSLARVEIDCVNLLSQLEEYEEKNDKFKKFFADKKFLEVYYEDLISDTASTLETIENFLEVPVCDLHSDHIKQNPYPLSQIIINYEEVVRTLASTAWEWCLDD